LQFELIKNLLGLRKFSCCEGSIASFSSILKGEGLWSILSKKKFYDPRRKPFRFDLPFYGVSKRRDPKFSFTTFYLSDFFSELKNYPFSLLSVNFLIFLVLSADFMIRF
jgi:hypothetical protein